jgi:hypothetical protein
MDSMDQQSVDLGGQPAFFANGYDSSPGHRLMDLRLSGPQRLDLLRARAGADVCQPAHSPALP